MAVLCRMPTIQCWARNARLSVHMLFSFLHSTKRSVTWLNSRWWLASCDRVMSALSAVLSTRDGRVRKNWECVPCTDCTAHVNDFEFIPTVKTETRNPADGYFGSEFPAICNHCKVMVTWRRKMLKNEKFWRFLKKDHLRKNLKNCSKGFHRYTDRRVVFKFR